MNLFTFVLTVIISFLGILFGAILTHHTREEVLSIRKLIPFLQFTILIGVFLILFFFFPFYVVLTLLFISFAFIYLFWHRNNLNFLDYIVLAMLFVISSVNQVAHLYVTLLVFIFGILSGALFYVMHTKHKRKTTKKIAHHKHSGNHYNFDTLTRRLFATYKFFFILSLIAFAAARLIDLFL